MPGEKRLLQTSVLPELALSQLGGHLATPLLLVGSLELGKSPVEKRHGIGGRGMDSKAVVMNKCK